MRCHEDETRDASRGLDAGTLHRADDHCHGRGSRQPDRRVPPNRNQPVQASSRRPRSGWPAIKTKPRAAPVGALPAKWSAPAALQIHARNADTLCRHFLQSIYSRNPADKRDFRHTFRPGKGQIDQLTRVMLPLLKSFSPRWFDYVVRVGKQLPTCFPLSVSASLLIYFNRMNLLYFLTLAQQLH